MPLPLEAIHAAVRITDHGDLQGTGSLVRIPGESGSYGYVVTAHHVICNREGIEVQVPNPFGNGELYEPVEVKDWRQPVPNVDLAIAPFPERDDQPYSATWVQAMLPLNGVNHPDLGGLIYYVGMFEPLRRPMARSGTIGALEQVGVPHEGGYMYDCHLVDCRSYGGFSGSPCLAEFSYPELDPVLGPNWFPHERPLGGMHNYTFLCGIFTAHYTDRQPLDGAHSRYGVGVMLPSGYIRKALMTDEAQKERRQWDREREAADKAGQPTLRNAEVPNEEFQNFEVLTKQLVNTRKPK